MKKKTSSVCVPIPAKGREFTCPNCCQETTVIMPVQAAFWNVVTCQKCNKKFLLENERRKNHAQLWGWIGKASVLIWATNVDFVQFLETAFC
jgi:transcription elongation factor Elf1